MLYSWKQTLQDVDITIPVPKGTRGRDLEVVLKKNQFKVSLKGKEPIVEVIVSHLDLESTTSHIKRVFLLLLLLLFK